MWILKYSFLRWRFSLPLLLIGILAGSGISSEADATPNDTVPASLIGLHHLGPEYLIYRFYINKAIGDNIGEGGGGGSRICCVLLPKKWSPSLVVDVRWAVDHIVRSTKPEVPETAEVEGIYHAKVPVEPYGEAGDLYVHFFPNGQVRIVVSSSGPGAEDYPIKSNDMRAAQNAVKGEAVQALFTREENEERRKISDDARKKYGDWR
jgi:hypothetical protein